MRQLGRVFLIDLRQFLADDLLIYGMVLDIVDRISVLEQAYLEGNHTDAEDIRLLSVKGGRDIIISDRFEQLGGQEALSLLGGEDLLVVISLVHDLRNSDLETLVGE